MADRTIRYDKTEKPLVNGYLIKLNEKICLKGKKRRCDHLGQYPQDYPNAVKIVAFYEFLYPFIVFFIWMLFFAQLTFSILIAVFSLVLLPTLPLILLTNGVVFLTLLGIGILIEIFFLIYLFRQIGVYAGIPVVAFLFSIFLQFIPFFGNMLASLIGLIPWGFIALGVHYIHYQVGIAIVFNAEDVCYTHEKSEGSFGLEW